MRNLVSVRVLSAINPIPNADAIEAAVVDGWEVVVKKDEFTVGDTILYFEIDAFLPHGVPEFAFLEARGSKRALSPLDNEYHQGHVLKTAKLRGVFSQGLILPLFAGLDASSTQEEVDEVMGQLGVFKYEAPIPAGTSGEIVAAFPSFAQKTDSERVQNLDLEFFTSLNAEDWVATEKIDGTSATFFVRDGVLHACSRNWEISLEGENAYSRIALKHDLQNLLSEDAIVQGEIYGEGIQGNPLKVNGVHFAVFNVQGMENDVLNSLKVPHLGLVLPNTIEEAVAQVHKMSSIVNPKVNAEGVVWWNQKGERFAELDYRSNFKVINNQYLLKHDR